MSAARMRVLFALGCAAVIAVESYALFFDRNHTFSIQGRNAYLRTDFGEGVPIAHAFLMRGNGLSAVRVQLSSEAPAAVRLRWRLFRQPAAGARLSMAPGPTRDVRRTDSGAWATFPLLAVDPPEEGQSIEELSIMEEGTRELQLDGGRRWETFPITRDGSSHDRWYVFEAQLVDPPPSEVRERAQIALVATHDNPDRGGSLFVDGVNKPGSLVLQADRVGPTLHQRFVADAEPNLPRWLQWPAVQWLLGLALHAALVVYAYALLIDRTPRGRADG